MKMLICSIGSKKSNRTLRFAAAVAKALGAETVLLGVVDRDTRVEKLWLALQAAARSLQEANLEAEVRVEVAPAEGAVVAELAQVDYDLIAVGSLGGNRSRRGLVLSVADRIIADARSSVLVIKGRRPALNRVLICASGTELGQMAVRAGAVLACGAQSEATLLHVVHAMPAMYAGLEQMEETLAELLRSDTDKARELIWATRTLEAECAISELKLRRGIVADEILLEAQTGDHDLIVLGSSRVASGFLRFLLGDVAREVVQRSERPVLVVRPRPKGADSG